MNNRANTERGIKAEILFSNTILQSQYTHAFKAICESLGIANDAEPEESLVIGGRHRKTDVKISFKDKTIPDIKISIKSFKAGYNHLERRKFLDFCRRNQFSNADTNFLKALWLRKAADTKKQKLVEDNEKERIKKIFSQVEPATSGILGNDHPQILALYNDTSSEWHIYNINNQVLNNIRNSVVGFTPSSSNISIGNYIVIQRKGSNKGESGQNPLTDISHGANDVQIKMKVKSYFNNIEPLTSYTA